MNTVERIIHAHQNAASVVPRYVYCIHIESRKAGEEMGHTVFNNIESSDGETALETLRANAKKEGIELGKVLRIVMIRRVR